MRGKLEAGAEGIERLQHLQPLFRLRGDFPRRQGEQRIGAQFRAADAAAQLIELRQAEAVGAMHDQRVRGRNIETGFDDRGGEQHIVFAVVEGRHDVVERARRHLPVRHRDAHFRHALVEEILGTREIFDARANIEGLPAAIALAQQRFAHNKAVERRDEGAHGEPVDRRRGDDREVAHAGQSQLKRARDRRRGEREHMHFGAKLLELLFVRDAEMLFFVHDQEAEILELDAPAQKRMRADHDIDLAVGQSFLGLCQIGRRHET